MVRSQCCCSMYFVRVDRCRSCSEDNSILCAELDDVKINTHLAGDGADIYENELVDPELSRPTLILIGVRLGIDKVNPIYYEALKVGHILCEIILRRRNV